MTLIRKVAGAASLFAVAALVVASFAATSASAQPANPMQVYGVAGSGDVVEGDEVAAWINGEIVASTTATAEGWVIDIQNGANGDEVAFSINGEVAAETVTYEGFGAAEVTLTIPEGETPTPAETGNAGLMGSAGTSLALVLALGVFAVALAAGGRTAIRRS